MTDDAFHGLNDNCTVGDAQSFSYLCTDSLVRLNATCSGRTAARVHHACPQPTTVCSVIDLEDRRVVSNNYCSAVTVADTVLCSCGFNRYDTDKSSSNNETVSAILALNGKLSIGAFRSFATGELDASVTAVVVQSLSTNQFLEASKMVLFAFATYLLDIGHGMHWFGH